MKVSAAPNKCIIIGEMKSCRRESDSPLKFNLEVEILNSKDVEGMPNFGKRYIGSIVSAFSVEDLSTMELGVKIQCQAEFVGGPFKGRFRVSDIKKMPNE